MNINPQISQLGVHPFTRTAQLLNGMPPPAAVPAIDLTIGEPRFPPPATISAILAKHDEWWGRYPPNEGPEWFRAAVARWIERRYNLEPNQIDEQSEILPVAGAREALYQVGFLTAKKDNRKNLFAMPTPHYAPYRAAAKMAGLEPFYMPVDETTSYLPDLNLVDTRGADISILIICSPSNPEGAVASEEYLVRAVGLARKHNFLLVVDECYSEIYFGDAPCGILKACLNISQSKKHPRVFENVLSVNSLSKRSSAAGLRVGFVAGDPTIVKEFIKLRAYCGGTTPVPNLAAAVELLSDETHVNDLRCQYRNNFSAVDSVLRGLPGYTLPTAGMFLWLKVESDEEFARKAWSQTGMRIIPGSYLGPPGWNGEYPAKHRCRIAMVHPPEILREAAERLKPLLLEMGR